jgi:erythronate-4-phosphate dehydrogenase
VRDADILAVRSTTAVNAGLLDGSRVRFVGTATIGTDHLDLDYLERAGIRWCHAPGCNANSVSEYIVACLLCLGRRHGFGLEGKTIGVVGVGNVGSRVVQKARALGLRVLQNDPPRERAGDRERESGVGHLEPGPFVSLDRILAEADIITLHVPLTREGPDATTHLADAAFFRGARRGVIFIDAARGAIVDSDALLRAMDDGAVAHAVLDTWEHEPQYRRDMLDRVDLGTPHIAGHSFEGKVNGTVMVYREACRFLHVPPTWSPESLLPAPLVPEIALDAGGRAEEEALETIVRRVYDVEADDRLFRAGSVPDDRQRAEIFDRLRREYPVRREFPFTRVTMRNAAPSLVRKVTGLGFRV